MALSGSADRTGESLLKEDTDADEQSLKNMASCPQTMNECTLTNGRAPHHVVRVAQIVERVHVVNKQMLDRLSTVVLLALVGSGVATCMVGALTYDIGLVLRLGS